jgi:hypothetical protein
VNPPVFAADFFKVAGAHKIFSKMACEIFHDWADFNFSDAPAV